MLINVGRTVFAACSLASARANCALKVGREILPYQVRPSRRIESRCHEHVCVSALTLARCNGRIDSASVISLAAAAASTDCCVHSLHCLLIT